MDTAIFVIIVVVGLSGAVLTGVLLKMIVTKDYSLLFGRNQERDLHVHVPISTVSINHGSLDLAVAHFVKETAEWVSDADRTKQEEELLKLRTHRQPK